MKRYEFWFITGSQHLYGPETLAQVAVDAGEIAAGLNGCAGMPGQVVFKPVVTTPEEIRSVCEQANVIPECAGVILWMHTFSPSKMWIAGLSALRKPMLHFNTQYNRDIPWDSIDMDFMNLNQSAHGDREHGFIHARLRLERKVVCGHWKDAETQRRIAEWARSAVGILESRNLKVARFGDNMREVAVTEGDKVEAEIKFGWSVNGYGLGDLTERMGAVSAADVSAKMQEYAERYEMAAGNPDAVKYQAKMEVALERFLSDGGFGAFTTTFENLTGLAQLPGLACQNLMAKGYGFGAEGDWKTAGLLRVMKLMAQSLPGGASFMEDYTYHMEPGNELVLGAHMLEVCPSIASAKPRIEVHALGIGGKADPARLVFDGRDGRAILATVVDLGDRFRLVVQDIEAVKPLKPMPKLPVARVMWKPLPDFVSGSEAWIIAGGAHHSVLSYDLTAGHMRSFAAALGIEMVHIGAKTNVDELTDRLRMDDVIWKMKTLR